MKLQYLGDSKDCFKWDYHDYLAQELRYPILNIAFMMTPDDGSNQGETLPRQFRQEVIKFCEHLQGLPVKTVKSIAEVQRLPKVTRANYTIKFHNEKELIPENAVRIERWNYPVLTHLSCHVIDVDQ